MALHGRAVPPVSLSSGTDVSYQRNPVVPDAEEGAEMPKIIDDRSADIGPDAPADSEQLARRQAIKQIKARRGFKISTAAAAVGVTLLVPIWATTEYYNAGGWPTRADSARARATRCGTSGSSTRSSRGRCLAIQNR
jgi:hypothetical protein